MIKTIKTRLHSSKKIDANGLRMTQVRISIDLPQHAVAFIGRGVVKVVIFHKTAPSA